MSGDDAPTISLDGREVPLARFDATTRTVGFECTSGRQIEHEWRGVPFEALLDAAGPPPETTHVLVEAGDGHRACVDLPAAIAGMLAVERDGEPLSGPRFVSPRVVGPRAVSDVTKVSFVVLEPDADPTDRESTGRSSA